MRAAPRRAVQRSDKPLPYARHACLTLQGAESPRPRRSQVWGAELRPTTCPTVQGRLVTETSNTRDRVSSAKCAASVTCLACSPLRARQHPPTSPLPWGCGSEEGSGPAGSSKCPPPAMEWGWEQQVRALALAPAQGRASDDSRSESCWKNLCASLSPWWAWGGTSRDSDLQQVASGWADNKSSHRFCRSGEDIQWAKHSPPVFLTFEEAAREGRP